jgi:hypothetical protein
VNTIAKTSAHELEDALDELEREYHHGEISREEWADRRAAHLAWFEERGIRDERGNEPADADADV